MPEFTFFVLVQHHFNSLGHTVSLSATIHVFPGLAWLSLTSTDTMFFQSY